VGLRPGDTVVVSGAAGGVGSIAVQLARRAGATVIGLAGPANHEWLRGHGVVPVAYGDGVADRIRAAVPKTGPAGQPAIDAFIDTFGADYVELALNELGVKPERVDTIVRFDAPEKYGIKAEGNAAGASADVLKELGALIAAGDLEIPVTTYPLADVRAAYAELEKGHTRGKIVLIP
jgi:NADPH:quinone reductase-like Zn-dependent oxidoreductase